MRSRDVLPMLKGVHAMHSRYDGFLDELVSQYVSVFFPGKCD